MNVNDKIIKNHKSKSDQVKKLKLKLKNTVTLGNIEVLLARENKRELNSWDYQGLHGYDEDGYKRDEAAREARVDILEEFIRGIKKE